MGINKSIQRKLWIIAILLLVILLKISFCEYNLDFNNFDASIKSWNDLSSSISVLLLIISTISIILVYKTLQEMKLQRRDSIRPHLLVELEKIEIEVNDENFSTNLYDCNNKLKLINIGLDHSIDNCILWDYDIEQVKKDFNFIKTYITNHDIPEIVKTYFNNVLFSENINLCYLKSPSRRTLNIKYIKHDEDIELELPWEILRVIEIYTLYSVLHEDNFKELKIPIINLSIRYKDVMFFEILQKYSIDLNQSDIEIGNFKTYINKKYGKYQDYSNEYIDMAIIEKTKNLKISKIDPVITRQK